MSALEWLGVAAVVYVVWRVGQFFYAVLSMVGSAPYGDEM